MGNDAMMSSIGTLAMIFDPTIHRLGSDDAHQGRLELQLCDRER